MFRACRILSPVNNVFQSRVNKRTIYLAQEFKESSSPRNHSAISGQELNISDRDFSLAICEANSYKFVYLVTFWLLSISYVVCLFVDFLYLFLNIISHHYLIVWVSKLLLSDLTHSIIKGQQATKPPRNFTGSYFKMKIFAVSSKSKSCHSADPFPFVKLKIRNHFINYEWHNLNSNSWEIYRCYLWSNWCIMY